MEQNSPTRGTKRKRYEPPKEDLATKIAGKLHHDVKEVRKAAKKAKTFETQKLVKRLKDLRNKNESAPEIADLESQLAVLKNISHEVIANTAFKTKINKDKILLHNDHVQRAVSKELHELLKPADSGTASAKIQSRLLSSKALASVVVEAVTDLRNVIEPKPIKDEDESQEIDEADNNEDPHSSSSPSEVPPSKKAKRHPDPRWEDGENGAIDAGWESGTVHSSDGDEDGKEEDGWESGSVHSVKSKEGDSDSGGDDDDDNDGDEDSERNALSDSNDFEGAEDSDDGESDSVNDSTSGGALPKKKGVSGAGGATKSVKSDKAPSASTSKSQSTFLPSLSVGFIRGDSDSEWSDSEAKVADLGERKNRRGQRARRAIWEKKYGKGANHKKKEMAERQKAIAASLAKRGTRPDKSKTSYKQKDRAPAAASFRNKEKAPGQHQQQPDSGWSQRSAPVNSNMERQRKSGNAQTNAERPLHPSWEAKRKLKEKESSGGIIPSQGKKIKFS